MKILNWLFYTGLWTQPFSMYGLMQIMNKTLSELQKDTKTGLLFLFFSFLPTIYIWNQNKTAKKNGKRQFGMLDSMNHQLDPAYQTSLRDRAKYPPVDKGYLSGEPTGIILGKYQGKYVRKDLQTDGHIMIIGGSGSGKSSCLIIPTLLSNPNIGLLAIDIKGELSRKTAKLGTEENIIFNPNDRRTYGYNPFYKLTENSTEQEIMECMQITAVSLIPMPAELRDTFWKQSARQLLTGLLIYYYKKKYHNLPDICVEILKQPMQKTLEEIQKNLGKEEIEILFLGSYLEIAEETLSGIASEVTMHLTIFATDQNIHYAFKENPLKMNPDMLNHGKHIYLSIQENKLTAYYDVLQLILNQTLSELEGRKEEEEPILFIIDELPRILSQGKLDRLLDGARTLRSRKVSLILVTQSVDALLSAYRESEVDDLISNCAYVAVLSATSKKTQDKIISWSGKYTERKNSYNQGKGASNHRSISYEKRNIVESEDLVTLPDTGELILITPKGYSRIKKASYYKIPQLRDRSADIETFNQNIENM